VRACTTYGGQPATDGSPTPSRRRHHHRRARRRHAGDHRHRASAQRARPHPSDQLEWLEELATASTTPVLVFGHHHPGSELEERSDHYFGITPTTAEALCGVISRCEGSRLFRRAHARNRGAPVRRRAPRSDVEVACVKDYPARGPSTGFTRVVHAARPSHRHAGRARVDRAHAGACCACIATTRWRAQSDRCFTQLW